MTTPAPQSVIGNIQGLTQVVRKDENEAQTRPLDFRLISRILTYMRPYAAKRNALLVAVVLRAIQLPALTWAIALTINGPVTSRDIPGVWLAAGGFFLLALSTQFVMHFRQRYALELGELVVKDLRNELFAHLQNMPLSFFNRTRVGRIISRMISDMEDVRVGVQEVLFVSLVAFGQLLVAAACMLYYDVGLFLLVLGMAPILWLTNRYFHKLMSELLRQLRESFSRVTATLAESVLGVRVTQGFSRQDENARLFKLLVQDHSKYNTRVMQAQGLFLPLLEFNSQFFAVLLLIVGSYRVLQPDSTLTVGELVGFFFMANMFFSPIQILGNQYNQALTAMAGAERLFALLDTPPEWTDLQNARPLPDVRGQVEFDNVWFSYEPGRPVLKGINFKAESGETIALVGHTGSGKTSIINLVARFWLPDSGQIRVDGIDLRTVTSESLHRQIGIVLQTNFLFAGTVLDNIRFARPDASLEEVERVCRQLGCWEEFSGLSQGLETPVGERGAQLSLGQRQMVCFARALLANPRILILDEATSSIDIVTEIRLQQALKVVMQGRTCFVVAHRLSTIREASTILVLDHGEIIERGNHHQLIARQGHYARLYERFSRAVTLPPAG